MTGGSGGATGAEMFELAERLYPIGRSLTGDGVRETLRRAREVRGARAPRSPDRDPGVRLDDPASGTCATRTCSIHRARGSSTSSARTCTSSATASPWRRGCLSMSCDRTCTRSRTAPRWCRTAPRTTPTRGGSASRSVTSTRSSPASTRCVSTARSRNGALTYGDVAVPGRDPDAGVVLVHTHTCHPSLANDNVSGLVVTTMLAARARRPRLPPLVPVRVRTGDDRRAHVAEPQPRRDPPDRGRARRQQRRRPRVVLLQAQPPRRCPHRPHRRARAARSVGRRPHRRLRTHRLRRAPVLRAGVRPSRGCVLAQLVRPVPRVPHLGRRPGPHRCVRSSRSRSRRCSKSSMSSTSTSRTATPARTASRASRARGLYPSTGGAGTGPDQAALLWVLNLSDGAHSLFDVAARSGLPFAALAHAAHSLVGAGLLEELDP